MHTPQETIATDAASGPLLSPERFTSIPAWPVFYVVLGLLIPHPQHHAYIAQQLNNYLNEHKWIAMAFGLLLAIINIQAYLLYFTSVRKLSAKQQLSWLEKANKPWRGLTLKALALPLKYIYMQSPELHQSLGSRVQLPKVSAETFRWQQQIMSLEEAELEEGTEVDVVVIGTGAGGAVAAYELASKGLAVLIVEEGEYYDRSHFNGNIPQLLKSLYRKMGMTATFGNTVIPVPLGRNVGGTTTINSGTCLRAPKAVLNDWQQQGLSDFSAEELDPWYEQVEEVLQVQSADDKAVGEIGSVIAAGASKLRFKQLNTLKRNAAGCDGQGLCQFGCPTDAKRSTNVSYIPRALEAGAMLVTSAKATGLHWDNGKISAVTLSQNNQLDKTVQIKTSTAIVAMGSLISPAFLANNEVKNKWLGRNLSIHPCGVLYAQFPDKQFSNSQKIPQGFGVSDYKSEGLMLEGATPPLLAYGLMQKEMGSRYVSKVQQYQQTGFFGFMIKDRSRGRVFSKQLKGLPLVHYHMNKKDFEQFLQGVVTLCKIYLAAGAEQVEIAGNQKLPKITCEADIQKLLSLKLKPRDFLISAYHPLGSCRMATDKDLGVVDNDLQVYGKQGLYVMDGSVVPSSLGANPQLTIMALASRSASKLAQRLLA